MLGLSEGSLLRGIFHAAARDPFCGIVRASEGGKGSMRDVVVKGRAACGGAVDGDTVALELVDEGEQCAEGEAETTGGRRTPSARGATMAMGGA